ncbi:hypothetical protein BGX24_000780 [Mortierella sp. AD032]|nr:hypothetical protein BGX24_000780 [Mortierella sp. AD032]
MANPQKPTLGRSQRRCQSEPSIPSRTCQHHHRHDHDAEPLSQRQHQYQLNPPVPDSVTSPESVRQQSPTSPSFAQYIPGSDNAIVSHEDVDVDMFQRMDIDDDPVTIPSLHPSYQHYDMEHRSAFVDSDPCSIRPPLAAPTETFIEYASPPLPSSPFRGFSRCMNMNMNINTSFSLNGFGHWAAPSTSSTSNITSGNVLSNTPASGPWSLHTAGASSLAIQAALLRDLNQSHSLITPRLDGHQPVV